MDAARHWARGGLPKGAEMVPTAETIEDFERFGMAAELADELREDAAEVSRDFPVFRDSEPSLRLFMAMSTQWHSRTLGQFIGGMGGAGGIIRSMRAGMRYEALPVAARGVGVRLTPEIFDDIRAMEAAALEEWADIEQERANG